MPLPKPAFFQSDRLPRWRSALAGVWIWLRLKFRHNPGFVTAAAAGSVGLVLTVILLLNGGLAFPGASKTAEPEIADDAELGEPEGAPSNRLVSAFPADVAYDAREGRATIGGVASRGSKVAPKEEDVWNEEEPAARATGTVAARKTGAGTPPRFKRTPFDEEPLEADNQDAQPQPTDRAEPLLVVNEPPDNTTGISEPTGSADETSKVEEEDEPAPKKSLAGRIAEPANEKEPEESHGFLSDDEPLTSHEEEQPATSRAPATRAKPPVRTDTLPAAETEPEPAPIKRPQSTTVITAEPPTKSNDRETPADNDEQFVQPQAKPGWKYSTTDPPPVRKEPAHGSAAQSRAVETAVYATQDPPATQPKTRDAAPVEESAAPARLSLEIRAPRNISPGQSFELEFVVTNNSPSPVKGASLSVALPPGLSHPLGPNLEQPIQSLAGCQRYRTRLTVKATAIGDASPRADISLDGKIGAKTTATLRVTTPGESRSRPLDPCACEVIRPVW